MATKNHNLSKFDSPLPSAADMRFGIVVAEWNREVTEALLEGAVRTLRAAGCPDMNIQVKYVPGTFELSLGAQFFAEYTDVDAVIALGCVIQGDTRHFDFICQGKGQQQRRRGRIFNTDFWFAQIFSHNKTPPCTVNTMQGGVGFMSITS